MKQESKKWESKGEEIMGKNKKKTLIITGSITVILLVIVIGLVLYLTTDFLRSDQELFFKYFAGNLEVLDQYLQDPNASTMQALKSAPYTVKSDISFDLVSSNPEIANQTTPPRNFSIAYTKNADPENNKDTSEAKIKYLTKELFKAQYVHDGDLHVMNGTNAITSAPVFNIFLGIENNNLKQLAKKMGIEDVSKIPNRLEKISITDLLTLSEEQKEGLQELVVKVANTQISKDKYYHNRGVEIEIDTKQVNANCYGVTLDQEEYKNVIIALLNEISQNEAMISLLLQKIMLIDSQTDITAENLKQEIQNQVEQLRTVQFASGITIEVYEANGKIVRTTISKNGVENYTFDYERGKDSIRTLISFNYQFEVGGSTPEETPGVTFTEDGYQVIEGSAVERPTPEPEPPTIITIKSIEIAKQVSGNQNNVIAIVGCQIGESRIKISLQNKTEPNSMQGGMNHNIIAIISDSDVTYFKTSINSNTKPAESVALQELNQNNYAVFNNRTPENIAQLINSIKVQLKKIYEQQMQVAKETQAQEDANGLTQIDPNAVETNSITSIENVIQ